MSSANLDPSWKSQLEGALSAPYMNQLRSFLQEQLHKKRAIFPKPQEYFAALNATPYHQVKVVIIGQDPYHGDNQAHGLCFSVKPGIKVPPSLVNIYKEMRTDLEIEQPQHGYLQHWAEQGVLLLNAVLTVERGKAGSHQKRGWEQFTDQIIAQLNERQKPMVFILWGSYAQKKGAVIDQKRHLVLQSPHPSPLSAHRGFFGCRHFSKANSFLEANGEQPINWQLPQEVQH